jgi:hypothetical protein
MMKTIRRVSVVALPSLLASLWYAYAWSGWYERDSTERNQAFRGVIGHIYKALGADVAGLFVRSPAPLVSICLACVWAAPLASLLWLLDAKRQSLSARTQLKQFTTSFATFCLSFGPAYVVGAVASIVNEPTQSSSGLVGWSINLWLRNMLCALPWFATFWALSRKPRKLAMKVALSALTWVVIALVNEASATFAPFVHPYTPYGIVAGVLQIYGRAFVLSAISAIGWSALVILGPWLALRLGNAMILKTVKNVSAHSSRAGVALVLAAALIPSPSLAYSKEGHHKITNTAWQVMRAAASQRGAGFPEFTLKDPGACLSSSSSPCGQAVNQAQWTSFLAQINTARKLIGAQPSQVPGATNGAEQCFADNERTPLAMFTAPVTFEHRALQEDTCGLDRTWTPPLLYNDITVNADGLKNQGNVLGFQAKSRDDDLLETRIDVLPTAIPLDGNPVPSPSIMAHVASKAYDRLLGAVFAPFVCAYEGLFGDASKCAEKARRIANKTNLVSVFTGLLPGFRLDRSELLIGFWHLMNVRSPALISNTYDDKQGMYLIQAGPAGVPGALDQAIIIASEYLWITITPDESNGTKRYTITDNDGHAKSVKRSKLDWNKESIGTTQFSPLDNLAYAGFAMFPNEPIKRFGWPLHAIGDATVPMHIVATPSYGHGPYEEWVGQHVDELVFSVCKTGDTACSPSTLKAKQAEQAKRVLQIGYKWRQYLRTHGIRDFITALAENTLSQIGGDTLSAWPWCDACSVFFDTPGLSSVTPELAEGLPDLPTPSGRLTPRDIAENPLRYYDAHADKIRGLVENAMGAKVAFLLWASESTLSQCIPNNVYGCETSADCCSGTVCTSNFCGVIVE